MQKDKNISEILGKINRAILASESQTKSNMSIGRITNLPVDDICCDLTFILRNLITCYFHSGKDDWEDDPFWVL